MAALFFFGCTDSGLPAGKRGGGFKLTDAEKHMKAIASLEERGIPYELDENGLVLYLLNKQAEVHGILRKIHYGEEPKENVWESTALVDQLTREKYEAAFNTSGIPYRILDHKGVIYIEWRQIYGPRVDTVRQNVDEEIMGIVIEKATNNQLQPDASRPWAKSLCVN